MPPICWLLLRPCLTTALKCLPSLSDNSRNKFVCNKVKKFNVRKLIVPYFIVTPETGLFRAGIVLQGAVLSRPAAQIRGATPLYGASEYIYI